MKDTRTQVQPSKESTTGRRREGGRGGGLRMAVKDRHCLTAAQHDGERENRKGQR